MEFKQKVYNICKQIPKGKVTTYKIIAEKLNTKAYQAVGNALRKNPYKEVPCHRVVKSNGEVGGFRGSKDNKEKARLLIKEGLEIKNNKIKDKFIQL